MWGAIWGSIWHLMHVVWADGFILFAGNREQLIEMIRDLTAALEAKGLRWKLESLRFIIAGRNAGAPLKVTNCSILIPWRPTLDILGTLLDSTASTASALEYRIAKADSAFLQHLDFWKNKDINLLQNSLL